MSRWDLPPETRHPLNDDQLLSTLETLEGEHVIVRISACDEATSRAGIASIVGVLRRAPSPRYAGREFSLGTPYPDRHPDHLAGGILFFDAESFVAATLRTLEGNDHFAISITTRLVTVLIQDPDSTYP